MLNDARAFGFLQPQLWQFHSETGDLQLKSFVTQHDSRDITLCRQRGDKLLLVLRTLKKTNDGHQLTTKLLFLDLNSRISSSKTVKYDWAWNSTTPFTVKCYFETGRNGRILFCGIVGFVPGEGSTAHEIIILKMDLTTKNSNWMKVSPDVCPRKIESTATLKTILVPLAAVSRMNTCRLIEPDA